MDKKAQFIDWLCGVKGAKFPFLQNIPEVKPPIGYKNLKESQLKEETLCGKPHDGCHPEEEHCAECMALKLGI